MIFARAAVSSASLITPRSYRSSSSASRCSIDFPAAGGAPSWLWLSLAASCSLAISGFSPPDRSTENFQMEMPMPTTVKIAANTRNAMNQPGIPLLSGLIGTSALLDLPRKGMPSAWPKGKYLISIPSDRALVVLPGDPRGSALSERYVRARAESAIWDFLVPFWIGGLARGVRCVQFPVAVRRVAGSWLFRSPGGGWVARGCGCLLYTSDAAD